MLGFFRYLRNNLPVQQYFYALPRLCLSLMGYWPNAMGKLELRSRIHFAVLAIGVLTEFHAGIIYAQTNQLTLALETFCPAGTSAVTLLKMYLMLHYRDDFYNVLKHLQLLLFQDRNESAEKQLILRQHCVMANRFNFGPLSAGFFTCTMYNLMPVLVATLLYLQGRYDDVVWRPPFNMTMPISLLKMPFFPLTYMFIAYTGYITIFMFGGCDAFYFEFCVHITTLFKTLEIDVRALFENSNGLVQLTGVQAEIFEQALIVLIKRQNTIIDLTHFFRERYRIIAFAHFVSASMVIGFSMFLMLTMGTSGLAMILYVGYTVAALSQLFIYCYGGTLVAESSVSLGRVIFECPWQIIIPKHRRYLELFILRSQRALTMAVPFFRPSLVTFAAILQTSGSILAVAKSIQ